MQVLLREEILGIFVLANNHPFHKFKIQSCVQRIIPFLVAVSHFRMNSLKTWVNMRHHMAIDITVLVGKLKELCHTDFAYFLSSLC